MDLKDAMGPFLGFPKGIYKVFYKGLFKGAIRVLYSSLQSRSLKDAMTSKALVPSKEWGNGFLGLLKGTLGDYHRDPSPPFPTKNQGVKNSP